LRFWGAGLVAIIVLATGLVLQLQRTAAIDAFATATSNLGTGMNRQTTHFLAAVDRSLGIVQADLTSTRSMTRDELKVAMRSRATFELLVDQMRQNMVLNSLALVDADGRMANASSGWPSAANDVSGRDFFLHFSIDADRSAFVGAPVKKPDGKWIASIARRIDDAEGNFAGLVVGELALTELQEFYRLAMPAHRTVYLVRRDGVVLVRYPERTGEIGSRVPDPSPWYATVAAGGGTYRAPGYFDPAQIIASVHPAPDLPFVVQASVLEEDALADWNAQKFWIAFVGMGLAAGSVLLLRLFARQYQLLEWSEQSLAIKNVEIDNAHQELDVTLDNLLQGVCFYDNDKTLVFANRRYCELYDLPSDAIQVGMSVAEVARCRMEAGSFIDQSVTTHLESIDAIIGAGKPFDAIQELTNGKVISSHFRPLPGRGWIITYEDITLRRAAEAKIVFLARHDALTGLANRTLLYERLDQAVAEAKRGRGFALLCFDLDRFKAVNDMHGHSIGDGLLAAVADRLRAMVREGDAIARLGGDEFTILQLGVRDATQPTKLANRILQSMSQPFDVGGLRIAIGVSIGVAVAPSDAQDRTQLLKYADLALYRAKNEGRGTLRFFEPTMDALARQRRAIEADLRTALALEQLELHYQPFVGSQDRRVSGFEALLRWRHPMRGLVPPGDFIPVAEEAGLIIDIGAWVLKRACLDAATWPDPLRVAVNLSTRQFGDPALVHKVADAIRTAGIAPERLELEITESLPLLQDRATLSTLKDLRALGIGIALDDFGTGFSSLSYLSGFPFDRIKIDRSFVAGLERDDTGMGIVAGIVSLAANLHMDVTAEGVETEGQFERLAAAGCQEIQGFLMSRPVPAGAVPALIAHLSARMPGPAFPLSSPGGGLLLAAREPVGSA